jgi:hypothetical protein
MVVVEVENMQSPITVHLTTEEVERVFENRDSKQWEKFLDVYLFLRGNLSRADAADISAECQKKFNYFYQVRRNAQWREKFYTLFVKYSKENRADFADVLGALFTLTGRVEASFASKFVATIDPNLPLIDRNVLTFIDRKLPTSDRDPEGRIVAIVDLYSNMTEAFPAFLGTACGRYLVDRFTAEHKDRLISPMKMLDFVLWQSGGKTNER